VLARTIPPAMVSGDPVAPKAVLLPTSTVPALMFIPPLYVLAPVNICVPVPFLVTVPVPEMTPENEALAGMPASVRVLRLVTTPAPANPPTVSLMLFMSSVAPDETEMVELFPRPAAELPYFNVPALIVVVPVLSQSLFRIVKVPVPAFVSKRLVPVRD